MATSTDTGLLLASVAAFVLSQLAVVPPAVADPSNIDVQMRVRPPDRSDSKHNDDAPAIDVTVRGAPNLPIDRFSLRDDAAPLVELKPSSRRGFLEGPETVAIAIVIQGSEVWIGNEDTLPEDDPARYPGILKSLQQALDRVSFKESLPRGSQGLVITYADKPSVRLVMGDLDRITGSALGTQSDYKGNKGFELVRAVELGVSELSRVAMTTKVLIVIGDGDDTNLDTAKAEMARLKKLAKDASITTFGIIYKGGLSSDRNFLSTFTTTSTVNSADNVVATLQSILARLANRQYLTFPGHDARLGVGLRWDGKPHNLILKIDKDDADAVALTLTPRWNVAAPGFPWLIVLTIVAGALLLVIVGVKLFSARPAPMPMPVVAPVAALEPRPLGPTRTVMIGAGGEEDGFPIVGWFVPLNGAQAYQTFRLKSGATKIGTAPPCDIVISDHFMSTEHCQINTSPQGFLLVDGGSTNGCFVNDRKIQGQHDLFDNDVFTLGKTSFRFKSIN
jgi:hypothetical protein